MINKKQNKITIIALKTFSTIKLGWGQQLLDTSVAAVLKCLSLGHNSSALSVNPVGTGLATKKKE